MKVQQFLEHHGIARNPFSEEDAQTDPVFKDHCIDTTYHPAWDKVYGDPREPATSIVFGEKGAGKTAMRLQILKHLRHFNAQHPEHRLYLVSYDDFNPFLDRFRDRLPRSKRRPERALAQWKLWDHMDAILSLAVTGVIDGVLNVATPSRFTFGDIDGQAVDRLDQHQARDLLLLAAYYDQSTSQSFLGRWKQLRKRLRYGSFAANLALILGVMWTLVVGSVAGYLLSTKPEWLTPLGVLLGVGGVAVGWLPYVFRWLSGWWRVMAVRRRMRTGARQASELRNALLSFEASAISGQPAPSKASTDDRYELLLKLQGILKTLGFQGLIVIVDRVDEPHLINGSAELMKALLWPMLDNKFLKHPGLGLKLMLPIELRRFIERENEAFYQRSRLDKQNVVHSFDWTGQALLDVTNARLEACALEGRQPRFRSFFDASISDTRLNEALTSLRVPRHLFKFMYRLLITHCNNYTADDPKWAVPLETFESTLALYIRDKDAFERGVGSG